MKFSFRVLLLVVLFAACNSDPERVVWRRNIRKRINPSELEQWATNCMAKGMIITNGASEQLRWLMSGYGVNIETNYASTQPEVIVVFMTGGGFGHSAIIVGGPNYKCTMGDRQAYWTNGIWFAWN